MIKTDLKLLNSASNFLELDIQHFTEENKDTEEVRAILIKLVTAKNLLNSAIHDIELQKNSLILNR